MATKNTKTTTEEAKMISRRLIVENLKNELRWLRRYRPETAPHIEELEAHIAERWPGAGIGPRQKKAGKMSAIQPARAA